MSYRDRLRTLRYTSPSNAEFELQFTELERSGGKKAPVTEFPNQDQGSVQDLGQTTPRFPINGFFSGPDYDRTADSFWGALSEPGPGRLEHPRWGVVEVLPVSITQTERFVDGAGRAVFDIDFVQASPEVLEYPRSEGQADQQTRAAAEAAATSVTESVDGVDIEAPGQLESLKDQVLDSLDVATEAINSITGITEEIRSEISSVVGEITRSIDELIAAPQELLTSLLQLYRLPADVATDAQATVEGYRTMLSQTLTAAETTTERYGELFGIIGGAQVQAIGVAAADSTVNSETKTRASALNAVDELAALRGDLVAGLDSLGATDYESAWRTRAAITAALRSLIDRAIDLPAERVHVTKGDIPPIALAFELYGESEDIQEMTERILDYNNIAGTDILLIPAGTEVRWYV